MPIIRSSANWEQLKYESEETAKDAEFQYLSTFEELNDYDLAQESDGNKKVKPAKGKRKCEKVAEEKNTDGSEIQPKKKKKRRKVTKASKKDESETTCQEKLSVEDDFSQCDMSAWQNLFIPEPVLKALTAMRFGQPTMIQTLTLPPAIRDRLDILGAAETGSGKTLAFGIPIIAGLLQDVSASGASITDATPGPKALILSPTRELAMQIKQHVNGALKYIDNIKVACVIGGLSMQKQQRLLKRQPEIVIATPGRLWALIKEGFEYVQHLYKTVHYLAIDETDRMVEQGHFSELSSILELLRKDPEANKKRQTFAFSATLTYVHAPPKRLTTAKQVKLMSTKDKINMLVAVTGLRKQHKVIDITRKLGTAEGLTETRLNCGSLLEKDTYLCYFLIRYPGRTLVFTNSIDCCSRLRSLLTCLRFQPLVLNGRMHQKQRLKNLERFSANDKSIILATDVAARGLDIRNIDHVIHYQVPRTPEIYIHRSGRTARSSQQGLSVMLVDAKDVGYYRRICRNLNRDKDLDVFPLEPKGIQMARERVQMASQLESMEHRIKRSQGSRKWFEKAVKDADLGESSDEDRFVPSKPVDDSSDTSKAIKSLRGRLNALLDIPLKKPLPLTKYPSAYQLAPVQKAATNDIISNGAIEAVNVAKEEEQKLLKKYGALKVKVTNKMKRKAKRKIHGKKKLAAKMRKKARGKK